MNLNFQLKKAQRKLTFELQKLKGQQQASIFQCNSRNNYCKFLIDDDRGKGPSRRESVNQSVSESQKSFKTAVSTYFQRFSIETSNEVVGETGDVIRGYYLILSDI